MGTQTMVQYIGMNTYIYQQTEENDIGLLNDRQIVNVTVKSIYISIWPARSSIILYYYVFFLYRLLVPSLRPNHDHINGKTAFKHNRLQLYELLKMVKIHMFLYS